MTVRVIPQNRLEAKLRLYPVLEQLRSAGSLQFPVTQFQIQKITLALLKSKPIKRRLKEGDDYAEQVDEMGIVLKDGTPMMIKERICNEDSEGGALTTAAGQTVHEVLSQVPELNSVSYIYKIRSFEGAKRLQKPPDWGAVEDQTHITIYTPSKKISIASLMAEM